MCSAGAGGSGVGMKSDDGGSGRSASSFDRGLLAPLTGEDARARNDKRICEVTLPAEGQVLPLLVFCRRIMSGEWVASWEQLESRAVQLYLDGRKNTGYNKETSYLVY